MDECRKGIFSSKWICILIASTFGIIAAMAKIIPLPVIAPILVFVGMSMVSQAFSSVKQEHYPAVVLAMFPYLANYLAGKFQVQHQKPWQQFQPP